MEILYLIFKSTLAIVGTLFLIVIGYSIINTFLKQRRIKKIINQVLDETADELFKELVEEIKKEDEK